jgi:hypothetical protein
MTAARIPVEVVELLFQAFPGRVTADMGTEEMLRVQGQRRLLDYIASMAAPPNTQPRLQETLTYVHRSTQTPTAHRGTPGPGAREAQGATDPRAFGP